jgi:hypothetical protein
MDKFKPLTKQEFEQFTKGLTADADNQIRFANERIEATRALIDFDPHLANIFVKSLEAHKAIYEYMKFRKNSN